MDISPLFAVDAEELLEQGNVQEAIDLCLKGLEAFPGYPAGEAILARAYKISGDSEKANEILESAIEKNPFNKGLDTLKKFDLEIENVEKIVRVPRFPDKPKKRKKRKLKKEESPVEYENKLETELSIEDFETDSEFENTEIKNESENIENLDNEEIEDTNSNEDILEDVDINVDEFDENEILLEEFDLESETEVNEDTFIENNSEDIQDEDIQDEEYQFEDNLIEEVVEDEIFDQIEENKTLEIDYEQLDLIPGLVDLNYEISSVDFENTEILNIEFDYNFPQFQYGYQIDLDEKLKINNLSDLANKLEDARIGKIKSDIAEPDLIDYDIDDVATETMGEIYFEQGAYKEAIKVFEKLKELKPEKIKLYDEKIAEIISAKENDLNNTKNFNFN